MFRLLTVLCAVALVQHGRAAKLELLGEPSDRIEGSFTIYFQNGQDGLQQMEDAVAKWPEHLDSKPEFISARRLMNVLSAELSDEGIAHVETIPGVTAFHHNVIFRKAQSNEAGSQNGARAGLDRMDQAAGTDGVYNYLSQGSGVDIYILDTGVDVNHPDWATFDNGENQALFVSDCAAAQSEAGCDNNRDPGDPDGHGTHVGGIAASPTYGVAKSATVLTIRVLGDDGSGSLNGILAGINRAATERDDRNRPSVINMSLGGGRSNAFNNAVDQAIGTDFVTIVAAGNEAQDTDNVSPASAAQVIAVGSSQSNDVVSSFSNTGPRVDIFAVGSSVRSLRAGTDGSLVLSGTSMACPTVAGAVAQLISVDNSRGEDRNEILNLLVTTGVSAALSPSASTIPGTPNLLLNVADEVFGQEGEAPATTEEVVMTTAATETPTEQPNVGEVGSVSTLGADGSVAGEARLEGGFLTRGIMLDLQCNENAGIGAQLQSITVYLNQQVNANDNAQAVFFYVEDFESFRANDNTARNRDQWTLLTDASGEFRVPVTTGAARVDVGQFELFEAEITLPAVHEFASAARQGIYVTFISQHFMAADFRGDNFDVDEVLAVNDPISVFAGRSVIRRLFGGNNMDPSVPILALSFADTGEAARVQAAENPGNEVVRRLNDDLDCLVSDNDDESTFSVQSGVMFDLTVDELEAADLPGVWLESFSVWLMDSMEGGIAEVYTTVNGQSFQGQELNEAAWTMIAQRTDMEETLNSRVFNEDEDSVQWMDENQNGYVDTTKDAEIIDDIEQAAEPMLYDFDFEMHHELRRDGTPQGFYVTFRTDQMRYYAVEGAAVDTEITSNQYVTMTGGVGMAYPFAQSFESRQFSGEACFSYEPVSAASSTAVSQFAVVAAVVVASLTSAFN